MTKEISPFKENTDYDTLFKAIANVAENDERTIYDYFDNVPKTTFVVNIVDELRNLGFKILKT